MRALKLSLLIVFVALPFSLLAESVGEADRILGVWYTEKDEAKVEIYRDGEGYAGKLTWLVRIEKGLIEDVDIENEDESLRSRPLVGLEILNGLEYNGKGVWEGGRIYDPDNGKTYRCKIKLRKDGNLDLRGYIGVSLIGRTSMWRVAD